MGLVVKALGVVYVDRSSFGGTCVKSVSWRGGVLYRLYIAWKRYEMPEVRRMVVMMWSHGWVRRVS